MKKALIVLSVVSSMSCGGDNSAGPAVADLVDFLPGTAWEGVAEGFDLWWELEIPDDTSLTVESTEPICGERLEFQGDGTGLHTEDCPDEVPAQLPFQWSGSGNEALVVYATDSQCQRAENVVTMQSRQTLTYDVDHFRCGEVGGPVLSVIVSQRYELLTGQ